MNGDISDLDRIRQRIAELVEQNWEATNHPLLLSVLGARLRREFPDSPELLKNSLKSLLTAWPVAQLVTHPTIPEKTGLVPLGVAIPENTAELFRPKQSHLTHPIYFRPFWRAFHTPLIARRFVMPEGWPLGRLGFDLPRFQKY
jgi:hypothetical protein